jgi:hypothetical protein
LFIFPRTDLYTHDSTYTMFQYTAFLSYTYILVL